jgi:hypothetical protein
MILFSACPDDTTHVHVLHLFIVVLAIHHLQQRGVELMGGAAVWS